MNTYADVKLQCCIKGINAFERLKCCIKIISKEEYLVCIEFFLSGMEVGYKNAKLLVINLLLLRLKALLILSYSRLKLNVSHLVHSPCIRI